MNKVNKIKSQNNIHNNKNKEKEGNELKFELFDPKIDFVFKRLFGDENNKDILISFLNAVIEPEDKIVSVDLKNTEIVKKFKEDKAGSLDIKATTSNNEHINIEMQLNDEKNIVERILYYLAEIYSGQIGSGGEYKDLERSVCIAITNFSHISNDLYHNVYRFRNIKTNEDLTKKQELHFIELPKFNHKDRDIDKDLVKWIEFIKNPDSDFVGSLEVNDTTIKKAKDKLIDLSRNREERELYLSRKKFLLDQRSAISSSFLAGQLEGKLEGMKEGIEQGIEQEKINIAKNLLDILENETISLKTGLTSRSLLDPEIVLTTPS